MTSMSRRFACLLLAGASMTLPQAALAALPPVTVYKDPNCGCCDAWVTHLRRAGFSATVVQQPDLAPLRRKLRVPDAALSCHTAVVGGYFVEGHVPAADVKRLLASKPAAYGIAAPGMPIGSPGMESPDGTREAYDVLLVGRDGRTRVFSTHR